MKEVRLVQNKIWCHFLNDVILCLLLVGAPDSADGLDSLACPELEEPLNSWPPVLMGQGENGAAGLVP